MKTTTAPIDPWTLKRDMSRTYQEKPSNATRHSTPVRMAPTHTSRNRTFAFGMK